MPRQARARFERGENNAKVFVLHERLAQIYRVVGEQP
jgi:hypothetical protein